MCKPKSEGGYRCASDGERARRKLCGEIHQDIIGLIPKEELTRFRLDQALAPSVKTQNFIVREASQDGLLRSAINKAKKSERAYLDKRSKIVIAYEQEGLRAALVEAYSNVPQDRVNLDHELEHVNAFFEQKSINNVQNRSTVLAQYTREAQEVQKARAQQATCHADALDVRAEEVMRLHSPPFKRAMGVYAKTEAGRSKLIQLAELNTVIRYSPAKSAFEDSPVQLASESPAKSFSRDFERLKAESRAGRDVAQSFREERYQDARRVVGDKNRCDAYLSRLNRGGHTELGETVVLSDSVSVVHPDDPRTEIGLYREGTQECARAVLDVINVSNSKFKELQRIEMDRVMYKDVHENSP